MARSRKEAQLGIQAHLPGSIPSGYRRGPQGTREAFRRLFCQPDLREQEYIEP